MCELLATCACMTVDDLCELNCCLAFETRLFERAPVCFVKLTNKAFRYRLKKDKRITDHPSLCRHRCLPPCIHSCLTRSIPLCRELLTTHASARRLAKITKSACTTRRKSSTETRSLLKRCARELISGPLSSQNRSQIRRQMPSKIRFGGMPRIGRCNAVSPAYEAFGVEFGRGVDVWH
jgi:hypothetical protein